MRIEKTESMSGAEVARLFGITRTSVYEWAAAGCPRNPDKTFNLSRVFEWRTARAVEQAETSYSGDDSNPDVRRWQAARADLKELELARTRGELVSAALIESQVGEAFGVTQSALMGLVQTLPPKLEGQPLGRIATELDTAIRETLEDLRLQLEAVANEEGTDTNEG